MSSSSSSNIFDPNGDIILRFCEDPEIFEISSTKHENSDLISNTDNLTTVFATDFYPNDGDFNGIEDGHKDERLHEEISMLISSRHMTLASPVFAKMLQGGFREGLTLRKNGEAVIFVPDDDPYALRILLNIIHGRTRQVPRHISFDLLMKVTVLVDKYELQEAVEVYSDMWIKGLKILVPLELRPDLLPWLCISWVFGHNDIFRELTTLLVRTCDSDMEDDSVEELPIPDVILATIQERRQQAISDMVNLVHSKIRKYQSGTSCCSGDTELGPACDGMVLGTLLRAAHKARIWPAPKPPFKGFNFQDLKNRISNFDIRSLCTGLSYYGEHEHHGVKDSIGNELADVDHKLNGLNLTDFNRNYSYI